MCHFLLKPGALRSTRTSADICFSFVQPSRLATISGAGLKSEQPYESRNKAVNSFFILETTASDMTDPPRRPSSPVRPAQLAANSRLTAQPAYARSACNALHFSAYEQQGIAPPCVPPTRSRNRNRLAPPQPFAAQLHAPTKHILPDPRQMSILLTQTATTNAIVHAG